MSVRVASVALMACASALGGCKRERETPSVGSVQAAPAAEATRPAAAAAPPEGSNGPTADRGAAKVLRIESNTQRTIDDLRIAAGNFWSEKYTDESGRDREGLTAMLFLDFRDDPSMEKKIRVHPGQPFTAGRYAFEVRAVDANTVTVTMRPLSP